MIAFIEGRVLFLGTGMMVVQTQSGVGYEIRVPETICLKSQSNQEIQLYIHTHVREDELTLYGFSSLEQKELFQMVIKTTGVGPKLGLAVLSQLSIDQLTDAVFQNNTAAFSQVSGIGRKTAAKLCLDLKDQLKNREMKASSSSLQTGNELDGILVDQNQELISALKNMGFQEREIRMVLPQAGEKDQPLEERLKKVLSLLTPLR